MLCKETPKFLPLFRLQLNSVFPQEKSWQIDWKIWIAHGGLGAEGRLKGTGQEWGRSADRKRDRHRHKYSQSIDTDTDTDTETETG